MAASLPPLTCSLGLDLVLKTDEPLLHALLLDEFSGWLSPGSGACAVEVEVRSAEAPAETSSLRAHAWGWEARFWGSRATIRLGHPTRVGLTLFEPSSLVVHLALQNLLTLAAPHHGALLLHAAGVVLGERAWLLHGGKGAGKTTACRNAPSGARVLSDESILCQRTPEGWQMHGTPFHSDGFVVEPRPGLVPLSASVLVTREPSPSLRPMPPAQTLLALLRTSGRLGGPTTEAALQLWSRLAEDIPGYKLATHAPEQVWPLLLSGDG